MTGASFSRLALIYCALALFACADKAASGGDTDAMVGGDMGVLPTEDMSVTEPPPNLTARELRIVGDRDRLVFHGQTITLKVEYIGTDAMNREVPIPNGNLRARMLDERSNPVDNAEGSQLRSQRGTTNAQGEAGFELQAGNRDVSFKVEVCVSDCDRPNPNDAAPVRFNVTVAREGAGGLTVRVTYDANMGRYQYRNLQAAHVHLFDRENCDLLRQSAANLQNAYFSLAPIEPFNEVDNSVSVGDLDDGARFSVAAQGLNEMGNAITFGCADGVSISGGEVTSVDIQLTDLPLEFKGTYKVLHKFNLTDLLRSSGNEALGITADVLEILRLLGDESGDRGEAIVDQICDLANVDDGLCRILRTIGGRLIDEAIMRFVPENVQTVFRVISDVLSIFSELTVLGEFQMNSIGADNRIEGNDNRWQRFRFTWRLDCPMGDDCTRVFPLSDLGHNDRPIFGTFNASLEGPEMYIEPHSVTFRYGLILMGIITNWVVPTFFDLQCDPDPMDNDPNGCGLSALIAAIVPCEDINDFLTGDPQDGLCERVIVESLAEILYDQLARLEFGPEQFTIDGTVNPVDTDGDLVIDRLDMGIWNGNIDAGDLQLEFNGCFEGCRPDPESNECVPVECEVPPLMPEE